MLDSATIISFISQASVGFLFLIIINAGFFALFQAVFLFLLMLKYKNGDGTLGEHKISLNEDYLLEKCAVNETRHSWTSVQKVVDRKKHILIFVSPTNAHIVPKRFFSDGKKSDEFFDEVLRLRETAKTNYSPSYLASVN